MTNTAFMATQVRWKMWTLWSFTVLFFAYQFILRLSPGVLIDEIMIKYQINASTFGLISAFYYIGYAGMQIPIGIMLDRFGIRYVVAISALICVLGNIPLVISDHWIAALFGRLIIGIGSAAGALGALHAVRINFNQKHMSKMMGFTIAFSFLGAIYGKAINRLFLEAFGLEQSIIYLAIPGIVIAASILLLTKDSTDYITKLNQQYSIIKSLQIVFKNWQVILLSLAGALMVGPLEAFDDIFGETYLVTVYNFSHNDAGYLTTSTIYCGMCIGSPLLAAIADRFKCHYIINITCGVVMAGAFYLMLNEKIPNYLSMFILTFTIGIMSAYQVIVISTVAGLVPLSVNGVAIATVNMFNMAAGACYNTSIGSLLDYYWTGEFLHGKRLYSAIAYNDALFILPITLMLGSILFFILKPKKGIC